MPMPPIDDSSLLAELTNDPAGLGYRDAAGAFKGTATLAALLTGPVGTVPNPAPAPAVQAPFDADSLILAASDASDKGTLASYLNGPAAELILAQDGPHLATAAAALGHAGKLTAADVAALQAVLTATRPDPAWPATVPDVSRVEKLGFAGTLPHAQINRVLGRA